MNSFDDGTAPSEADRDPIGRGELERSLTPPDDTAISPDLLDELFEAEDPRVQSGIADDDSDDDLDFIRMSGLTSPEVSADIGAIDELPQVDERLTPPVSFYEPGVADVDAAMAPEPEAVGPPAIPEPETVVDEAPDTFAPDELETLLGTDDAEILAGQIPEPEPELPPEDLSTADLESPSTVVAEESAEPDIEPSLPVEADASDAVVDESPVVPEVDPPETGAAKESIADDLAETEPVPGEQEPDARDVVDLDSLDDDEVFPDLLSPTTASADTEEPAEDAVDPTPETGTTGKVELVDYPAADEISTDENHDDQVLVIPEENVGDDASLDNSIIDDILVEPESDSSTDESVLEEMAATEPVAEAAVESDSVPVVEEPVPEEWATAEPVAEAAVESDSVSVVEEPVPEELATVEPVAEASVESDSVPVIEEPVSEEVAMAEPVALAAVEPERGSADEGLGLEEVLAAELVAEAEAKPDRQASFAEPATLQTYGRRSNRHHRRHQSSLPRILKAAAVFLVIGGLMAYAGYEGYRWFEIRISNPTTLYYEAESAAVNGKHLQASRLYEEFTRRNSEHPLAADAMFATAYQMQQVKTEDTELARQYNDESLALLSEFVRRYPDHERAGRAQSLMGIVHYRRGDYRAAVDAFIDRDAILRDPAASLPMLRTLARSYARLGEYEAAHTTFTRAANLPGNPSPDADYDELGEMYRALAQSADTPDQHTAYQELALVHWSHAIRYPGINPTRKNAIRMKVDLLSELGELKGTPPAIVIRARDSDIVVPLEGSAEMRPVSFELTSPLPFGPIVKGVPGNDEPEPIDEQAVAPPVDDGPIAMEFQVVPEHPSEIEDSESLNARIAEPDEETQRPRYHEIAPGEQLLQIAADRGISAADLMRWNRIDDADHIEIGQRLILHEPAQEDE